MIDARVLNWRYTVPAQRRRLLLLPVGDERIANAVVPERNEGGLEQALSGAPYATVTLGKDPATVLEWIATDFRFLRTDLDVQTLVDLGLTATQIPLSHVRNVVVPATSGVVGAADVVFISPAAHSLYAQMRKHGSIGG